MFEDDLLPELPPEEVEEVEEPEAPKGAPLVDIPEVLPITVFIEDKTLSVRVPDDADRMSIAVGSSYLKVFFTGDARRFAQVPVSAGEQLVEVVVGYAGSDHQDVFRGVVKPN